MRTTPLFAAILVLAGCGASAVRGPAVAVSGDGKTTDAQIATGTKTIDDPARTDTGQPQRNTSGTWVGVAAESDVLAAGDGTASIALWVDAPTARPRVRVPMDIALVIDTSGSMAGAKIENARARGEPARRRSRGRRHRLARRVHRRRADDRRADDARRARRAAILREDRAPRSRTGRRTCSTVSRSARRTSRARRRTHAVRRVVVISDGIANVGPSSPEALGALAERGLRFRAQVTSLGVGNDYDERTLERARDALERPPLSLQRAARDGVAPQARARSPSIDGRDRRVRRGRARTRRRSSSRRRHPQRARRERRVRIPLGALFCGPAPRGARPRAHRTTRTRRPRHARSRACACTSAIRPMAIVPRIQRGRRARRLLERRGLGREGARTRRRSRSSPSWTRRSSSSARPAARAKASSRRGQAARRGAARARDAARRGPPTTPSALVSAVARKVARRTRASAGRSERARRRRNATMTLELNAAGMHDSGF